MNPQDLPARLNELCALSQQVHSEYAAVGERLHNARCRLSKIVVLLQDVLLIRLRQSTLVSSTTNHSNEAFIVPAETTPFDELCALSCPETTLAIDLSLDCPSGFIYKGQSIPSLRIVLSDSNFMRTQHNFLFPAFAGPHVSNCDDMDFDQPHFAPSWDDTLVPSTSTSDIAFDGSSCQIQLTNQNGQLLDWQSNVMHPSVSHHTTQLLC
eukprot:c14402_g1_i1.p1 GENE.c14402_g1_i1~~c14402_g1_i1.p1  ORF type:complete len:210 (-),score=22.72 c14402_g1_i1:259-888(-)